MRPAANAGRIARAWIQSDTIRQTVPIRM